VISGNVAFKGTRGPFTLITTGSESTVDQNGGAVNPLAFGNAAYLPQMPVGTQSNAKPISRRGGKTTSADGDANVGIGVGYYDD